MQAGIVAPHDMGIRQETTHGPTRGDVEQNREEKKDYIMSLKLQLLIPPQHDH